VRSLSPDEAELWAKVAATIRPLSRQKLDPQPPEPKPKPVRVRAVRPSAQTKPPVPPKPIGERTLDGSWDKRLRGGTVEPDSTLDLHGMTLDTAWQAIDRGLERAIRSGDRIMLLITGHHRPGDPPVERGRIRAAVHDWLAHSRHASDIAAVRGAHRKHGGGGSLYIILRRSRGP
jgi:DNA-nicking Smr family endonuclease